MPLDVVHRVSNGHSYHRINSPSAAVTTLLLFTFSSCSRAIRREARQARYLTRRLNSKGTSYFQRKRDYDNLSFIPSLGVKSRKHCPFLLLCTWVPPRKCISPSGTPNLSTALRASTPPHTLALQTGIFSIFPKRFNCPFEHNRQNF